MFSADVDKFRFGSEFADAFKDQRVFITGSGKDGGIGQAFALAAAMNGAASVGVHFHSSYQDAFDLVLGIRNSGCDAFPVQADVTNPRDMWATRSYIIDQMGGKPPSVLICNSGLTESGVLVRTGAAPGSRRSRWPCAGPGSASTSSTPWTTRD